MQNYLHHRLGYIMKFKKMATLVLFTLLVIGFTKTTINTEAATVSNKKVTSGSAVSTKQVKKKSTKKYTKAQLRLMACIINSEAGNQSYQGKLAVGIVIMNRVKSKDFPNTVKGVVYQKYQFSPVRNGSLKRNYAQYDNGKTKSTAWKQCIKAAKNVLSGQTYLNVNGKIKNFKSYQFFSVGLAGARFRLGGHRFK